MKIYAINGPRKARIDIGNCRGCGTEIKAGETYKYVNPTAFLSGRIFFCEKCEVNQSIIGKNANPVQPKKSDAEVQSKVEKILNTTVAEVEKKIAGTEPATKKTAKKTAKKDIPAETTEAPAEAPETDAVYCTKCKGTHKVGSRRYRQHTMYLGEKS